MQINLRRIGMFLGALFALVLVLAGVVFLVSENRLSRKYEITPASIEISDDQASLERGEYLLTALTGCQDCHGHDLGGKVFIDDPLIGAVYGSNLTPGQGSKTAFYSDSDWVRSIRHGVDPDGRVLFAMPSQDFANLNPADLAAVITYLKNLPPVDRQMPESKAGPLSRLLLVAGLFPPPAAEIIDHDSPLPGLIEPGPTAEYGEYLASVACINCHRSDLTGGTIPGVPPDWPPAPNLSLGSSMSTWSEAEFIQVMRSGATPDKRMLNPAYMPWSVFMNQTDSDLQALYTYIQSMPD
jgi:mono/diheme cytochrome c family protein